MLRVGLLGCLALAALPAIAQDSPVMMAVEGRCEELQRGWRRGDCFNLMYIHMPQTNRTSFTVTIPRGVLGFSGEQDEHPSPDVYRLVVDSFVDGSKRVPASGSCTASVSPDGTYLYVLTCDAQSPDGIVKVRFRSSGKPIERVF